MTDLPLASSHPFYRRLNEVPRLPGTLNRSWTTSGEVRGALPELLT